MSIVELEINEWLLKVMFHSTSDKTKTILTRSQCTNKQQGVYATEN
jgi:hypothetical protein